MRHIMAGAVLPYPADRCLMESGPGMCGISGVGSGSDRHSRPVFGVVRNPDGLPARPITARRAQERRAVTDRLSDANHERAVELAKGELCRESSYTC